MLPYRACCCCAQVCTAAGAPCTPTLFAGLQAGAPGCVTLSQAQQCIVPCLQVQAVDWGDVGEARQASELMAGWAAATTADALELLSPAFAAEEVQCMGRAEVHGAVHGPAVHGVGGYAVATVLAALR